MKVTSLGYRMDLSFPDFDGEILDRRRSVTRHLGGTAAQ